jgi:molecular chaperone GrpE (heat shock protein)
MADIEGNELKIDGNDGDDGSSARQVAVSEADWAEMKTLLDKRYSEIATLLRYNKTKDESIQRLGAEVQKYREGFAFTALRPFINALIALREDCRKSVRDAKQFPLDAEKAKKYIEYLVSDFDEMLTNIGLERKDGSILINGKPLLGQPQPKTAHKEPAIGEKNEGDSSQASTRAEPIKNISELVDYFDESVSAIRLAIEDRNVADRTIQEYIALAARTDAEHYLAMVAPVSRSLYALYDNMCKKSVTSGDEPIARYDELLNYAVDEIEKILTAAGVQIEVTKLDRAFDTQKHKILKTVPTDEETLDRTIVDFYTDCYTCEEKVVYQSKVDVYKFQK